MLIFSNIKKIYDGTSQNAKSTLTNIDLFIEKGLIKDVKPHDPQLSVGDAHTKVNCSELFVTPGIIDCHNHITILGLNEHDTAIMESSQAAPYYLEKILYTSLVHGGVTTLRDVGGATDFMKRMVDAGVLIGPRLKIAICMLSTTGGHADFRGPDRCHGQISSLWGESAGRPSSIVDGPWACRKRVREIAACGADLIKICASSGVTSPRDKLEHRDFHPKEIEAICQEANDRGLRVAAHAHSQTGIDMAIKYGVHDLQHISYMDEKQVDAAHRAGCTVTPTSWVVYELQKENLPPAIMEKAKKIVEVHANATSYALKGGLKVLAGTDPVIPGMHGKNYKELAYLMQEGASSLQAWYGATGLAADEIGQHDTGEIKTGKRADLLFCKNDVIADASQFDDRTIVEVMKDGVTYRGAFPEVPYRNFASNLQHMLDKGSERYT